MYIQRLRIIFPILLASILFSYPLTTLAIDGKQQKTANFPLKTLPSFKNNNQDSRENYVPGEVLVKFRQGRINLLNTKGRSDAEQVLSRKNFTLKEHIRKSNISVLKTVANEKIEDAIKRLQSDPNVEYAQPNYRYYPTGLNTNDPSRDKLWSLNNFSQTIGDVNHPELTNGTPGADIHASPAWAYSEGENILVAVIDTGVAYNHPDLAGNMWDGSNCKDEDGNSLGGCWHGYDFEDGDKIPLPTTSSHGTHVAGTIAGLKNNNIGIMGVAPKTRVMALKSRLTTDEIVKAISFASQNGAKVINASWGCYVLPDQGGTHADCAENANYGDQALSVTIAGFSGLFITAAGNGNGDNDTGGDNHDSGQTLHSYPCDLTLPNIICVAATDANDDLASFSDYGTTSVDVGAPGQSIFSTIADSLLTNETFESITPPSLPSGWTKGGTNNNWGTYNFSSGNVLYGDLALPYANSSSTTVTSPTFNLGGSTGATMSFRTHCDTEYTTTDWRDYMALEISSDGTNFTEVGRWDEAFLDNDSSPVNTSPVIYLSANFGTQDLTSNFRFRFHWITNSNDNSYDGCWVDNVKITKFSDGSDERYDYLDGTSMAAPHVAGLAALLWGYKLDQSLDQVKATILDTGDERSALQGKTVSGRRINAEKAILSLVPTPTPTPTPSETPTPSPTPSESPSPTPSPSESPTPSPTPSETPTPTPEPSLTPTPTPSVTPTPEPFPTPSPSTTPTPEPSPSETPSPTPTPSESPTPTPTPSPSESPTPTPEPPLPENTKSTSTSSGGGGGGGSSGYYLYRPSWIKQGDANGDNRIDIEDFNILLMNWGSTIRGNQGDLNYDGVVDILDFNELMKSWSP